MPRVRIVSYSSRCSLPNCLLNKIPRRCRNQFQISGCRQNRQYINVYTCVRGQLLFRNILILTLNKKYEIHLMFCLGITLTANLLLLREWLEYTVENAPLPSIQLVMRYSPTLFSYIIILIKIQLRFFQFLIHYSTHE